jgi:drug/metabolite transporter (DMT)-like permease
MALCCCCCCLLYSLTIYALSVMPTHTYTMLSDLKIITTGIGGYLLLGQQLTGRAVASLVLLFLGICLGQLGTISGGGASAAAGASATAAASVPWVHAVLVMCLVAVLSALASVYTEW